MAPPDGSMIADRRHFLRLTGATGLAAAAGSDIARAQPNIAHDIPKLPDDALADEAFWTRVKLAFSLKPGLIHLNSANLASCWNAVLETAAALSRDVSSDPSFENRIKFAKGVEATRRALARMLGAEPGEIAITRNTSESNRTVISGIALGPEDEVILWDQNHESNNLAWDVFAARTGFKVVRVSVPSDAREPAELTKAFISAFTSRTKMLAFSHVSNVSGLALPAVELCRLAAERGVLTLVDGAQTFGMMNLNLREMGCDFFTGSAHKWLGGPHETGILYVRAERIDSLWPSMVTHDWESMAIDGARKFECLGQRQDGRIDALGIAVELHEMIGRARIERRIRFLADYLRIRLASTGKKIEFLTPANPAMSAGIVMFFIDVKNARGVMERLYGRHSISALALPVDGRTLVRFSPNIYNTLDELDLAAHAVAALA